MAKSTSLKQKVPYLHEQEGIVLMDVQMLSASFVFAINETIKMNQRKVIALSATQVDELNHSRKWPILCFWF